MEPAQFIKSYKIKKFVKSMRNGKPGASISSPKPGVSSPTPSAGAAGTGQTKDGFPVGTVRNGRQKVSSNPSKWVDVSSGKTYGEHHHEPHEHHGVHSDEELKSIKQKTISQLKGDVSPDHLDKAEKILETYLHKKLDYKNMVSLANSETSKLGAVPKDYQERAYKLQEQADKLLESFTKFVKIAKKHHKAGKTDGG